VEPDRFDTLAERIVPVLPDGPGRWCVMIGAEGHGTVAYRSASRDDCEAIAGCYRDTIAAAIREAVGADAAPWLEWMDAHAEWMAAPVNSDASREANAKMGRAWVVMRAAWGQRRGVVAG
jgi:hypothetical protein